MKKVGIMSMQRIINYGSYLQAYALSNTIKKIGHEVEFVDFKIDPCIIEASSSENIENIDEKYIEGYSKALQYRKDFEQKYLPDLGIHTHTRNERPEIDTLVIGSDEVFNCLQKNPEVGYSLELFGLNNNAKKIISYAASCGHTTYEKLDEFDKVLEVSNLLEKFDSISVRDENTHNFAKKMTKKEIVMHLDPVLIYDFSEDLKDVKIDFDNYIIVYGYTFSFSDEECKQIKEFAQKHNKKVLTIGSYQKCADLYVNAHPLEILKYFEKADFVITNTFHGTIFSVKTKTPFATKIRKDFNNEKLLDLLERLDFKDRQVFSYEELDNIYNQEIDFEKCHDFLESEKKKSIEYLKNNI